MKKLILAITIAAMTAVSASAITINSDRLLGFFTGGGPANPTAELGHLNTLIDGYNGDALPLPAGYTLDAGSDVPAPDLGKPSTADVGADLGGSDLSVLIDVGMYLWVSLKTGNDTGFYYIGDLTGEHTLENDVFKQGQSPNFSGISHYNFFGERVRVPDSGATLALLGLALAAMGFLSRRR